MFCLIEYIVNRLDENLAVAYGSFENKVVLCMSLSNDESLSSIFTKAGQSEKGIPASLHERIIEFSATLKVKRSRGILAVEQTDKLVKEVGYDN